jgi:hypothetical protein
LLSSILSCGADFPSSHCFVVDFTQMFSKFSIDK